MDKYEAMRQFILDNFETTTNINDRLHTKDIIDILANNKFLFSTCKMAEVFKNTNLGTHRSKCNIKSNIKTGYYFLRYKGQA